MPRFGLYVQDLVGRLSGSGEHFSLCKGAHGCKSRLLIFVKLAKCETWFSQDTLVVNLIFLI